MAGRSLSRYTGMWTEAEKGPHRALVWCSTPCSLAAGVVAAEWMSPVGKEEQPSHLRQ